MNLTRYIRLHIYNLSVLIYFLEELEMIFIHGHDYVCGFIRKTRIRRIILYTHSCGSYVKFLSAHTHNWFMIKRGSPLNVLKNRMMQCWRLKGHKMFGGVCTFKLRHFFEMVHSIMMKYNSRMVKFLPSSFSTSFMCFSMLRMLIYVKDFYSQR